MGALLVGDAQYAVYFTEGGAADLDISGCRSGVSLRWFGIDQGGWVGRRQARSGAGVRLRTPGPCQWAAVLQAT